MDTTTASSLDLIDLADGIAAAEKWGSRSGTMPAGKYVERLVNEIGAERAARLHPDKYAALVRPREFSDWHKGGWKDVLTEEELRGC